MYICTSVQMSVGILVPWVAAESRVLPGAERELILCTVYDYFLTS